MTRIKSGLVARNCITTCGLGVGGSGGLGAIAGGNCAFCGAALIGIGAFCMGILFMRKVKDRKTE